MESKLELEQSATRIGAVALTSSGAAASATTPTSAVDKKQARVALVPLPIAPE